MRPSRPCALSFPPLRVLPAFSPAYQIIDTGDGLKQGGAAAVCKAGTVTDGPYIEGKQVMGGYTFVAASSLARAPVGAAPETDALLALMYLHAARFEGQP
ncbi:hypothetical protein ACMHYB_52445 [Sorangium sp. So ce1128]